MQDLWKMRVCRTCLSRNNTSPLFGELSSVRFNSNQLFAAAGVQINQNDGLPQTACKSCIQTIKDILLFRQICTKTNEILKDIINIPTDNSEIKIDSLYQDIINGDEKISERIDFYPVCVTQEPHNSKNSDRDTNSDNNDDVKLISFVNKARNTLDSDQIRKNTGEQDLEDTSDIIIEDLESDSVLESVNLDDNDFDLSMLHDDNALGLTKDDLAEANKLRNARIQETRTQRNTREEQKARNRQLLSLGVPSGSRLQCSRCGARVARTSFLAHARTHCEQEHACEHCGKKFHSRNHMFYHQQRKHGKLKRLACDKCTYRAVDRLTLIRHQRGAHSRERPYVCAECGRAFRMRACIVQHMRSHSVLRTRQCDRCPAMFKNMSQLGSHQSKVHFMTYTYPCYLCPTVYKGRLALKRHLVNIHGIPREQQQTVKCVKTKK